jgi:hypothetical protein
LLTFLQVRLIVGELLSLLLLLLLLMLLPVF